MHREDNFEWDERKAARNESLHDGVSFKEAKGVFCDPDPLERLDDRADYGEERYIRIAMAGEKVLVVVYTERGRYIRLISARKADKGEQHWYYRKRATGWGGIDSSG
jgi:uncharacterized protein